MIYKTGTVTTTHGSSTITGTGTEFLKKVDSHGIFRVAGEYSYYPVDRIISNTELLLARPYQGVSGTDVSYSINMSTTANMSLPLLSTNIPDPTNTINQALNAIDKNAGRFLDFHPLTDVEYSGENGFYVRGNYRTDELKNGRAVKFLGGTGETIAYDWIDDNSFFAATVLNIPSAQTVNYYDNNSGESALEQWDVITNLEKSSYVYVDTIDTSGNTFDISGEVIGSSWANDDTLRCFGKTKGLGIIDTGVSSTSVPVVAASGEALAIDEFKTSDLMYNYNKGNYRSIIAGESNPVTTQTSSDDWEAGDSVYTIQANIKTNMTNLTASIDSIEYGAQSQIGEDDVNVSHINFGLGSEQVNAEDLPISIDVLDATNTEDAISEINDVLVNHLATGEAHGGNDVAFADDAQGVNTISSVHLQDAVNELKARINASAFIRGTVDDADDELNFYAYNFMYQSEDFYNSGEWWCRMESGINEGDLKHVDSFDNSSGEFTFASGEGFTATPEDGDIFTLIQTSEVVGQTGATGATGAVGPMGVENLLSNSGFGVWSNSTLENVGTQISVSDIASGVCTTSDTEDLAVGKLVEFGAGGSTDNNVYRVTAVSTNVSFTVNDTSITDATNATCYEVTPGCVATNSYGPDGWIKTTSADIYREHSGDNTKDGSFYALKFTKGADTNESLIWPVASLHSTPAHYMKFRGRTACIGMWVKTSVANNIKVGFYDGAWHLSDYHTGGGEWEWLEHSYTPATDITRFNTGLYASGSTADESYHTQPMLIFGSSIGEGNYSQPQGEIVWCDASSVSLNDYVNASVSANVHIDIESQTNGMVPKGFKALNMFMQGKCATAGKSLYIQGYSLWLYSQVTNLNVAANNWVRDYTNNGEIDLLRSDTFTSVYIKITGVQVS